MTDDGDWILVSSKRDIRRANVSLSRSLVKDEAVCREVRDRIVQSVSVTISNGRLFLASLLKRLRIYQGSSSFHRMVALGIGSPTALSLPLTQACCYQLAVCLVVRDIFDVENVDVFDPIMDANDVEACRSLLFEYRSSIPDLGEICRDVYELSDEESVADDLPHLILWMPHCEASLYKAVLLAIDAGEDPLCAAETLAGHSRHSPRSRYNLSNVVLVGNSLKQYVGDNRLPEHLVERVVEVALPSFAPFPQAFGDTYITRFR